jgi:hypothetical protein
MYHGIKGSLTVVSTITISACAVWGRENGAMLPNLRVSFITASQYGRLFLCSIKGWRPEPTMFCFQQYYLQIILNVVLIIFKIFPTLFFLI